MKLQFGLILAVIAIVAVVYGCGKSEKSGASSSSGPMKVSGPPTTTPSGLQYWDIVVGNGPTAVPGNMVHVHYSGYLTTGENLTVRATATSLFPFRSERAR